MMFHIMAQISSVSGDRGRPEIGAAALGGQGCRPHIQLAANLVVMRNVYSFYISSEGGRSVTMSFCEALALSCCCAVPRTLRMILIYRQTLSRYEMQLAVLCMGTCRQLLVI